MADEEGSTTPGQGQSEIGGQGTPKKKIAGKFDTIEEAVEKGYVGLEQGFTKLTQQFGAVQKLLEDALTPQGDTPIGDAGRVNAYGRGTPAADDEDAIDPAKFLVNPGEYLEKREKKLMGEITRVVQFAVGNATIVNDFKAKHPDLAAHEKLVATFLRDTDPRKKLNERMEDAATAAREYIATIKTGKAGGNKDAGRTPEGDDYVEDPANAGGPAGGSAKGGSKEEADQDLAAYARERNQSRAAAFMGVPQK